MHDRYTWMNIVRAPVLLVLVLSAAMASVAYSQTAPKDVLPPTSVPHPPVSPTLNLTTPSPVSAPSPMPTAIMPQAPLPASPSVPQSLTPGVVETNKLPAALSGGSASAAGAPSTVWTNVNSTPSSVWDKAAPPTAATPSAAKIASDPWSAPRPGGTLWNSGTTTGPANGKSDWK